MGKCDVIIPVYKSPEWVNLCVYSLFKNTGEETLNKVYLIDDCDDEITDNCLNNLKKKYGKKIVLLKNEKNLGFVGSTNRGMKESKADYVLLLNTDCIITNNTIEKMISNIENDKKIGLVCPISSNAANLTLEMFEGFNFSQMNNLLESKFKGKLFDACTVVGNCLMITRDCINKIGFLDEAYGMGYGEETDYQFKALAAGFSAKVSIDTYVFHKSEASFGTSEEKQKRLQKNRDLFFSRWGDQYYKELAKYEKNDPIKYINKSLSPEDKIPNMETVFYLNGIVQNAGGVHVVVDIINHLAINGQNINLIYDVYSSYKEIMLFNPISSDKIDNARINKIVATIWSSVYSAKVIADKKKCKILYFVQGYENLFENSGTYGIVDTSFKCVDSIFTISKYLNREIKENYSLDSTIVSNGINYDLIYKNESKKSVKSITMILRNNVMKGDWILIDLLKKMDLSFEGLEFNVVYMNEYIEFPQIKKNKLNKFLGPLSRNEIIKILQNSDIYVDASLNEGFGLTPLEAMAAGNVVVVSDSFGINDYLKNKDNGFIISAVNNTGEYLRIIESLVNDNKLFKTIREKSLVSVSSFDFQNSVDKYIRYLSEPQMIKEKQKLTKDDKFIIDHITKTKPQEIKKKRKLYYVAKLVPKFIKRKLKKIISFLYGCYEH